MLGAIIDETNFKIINNETMIAQQFFRQTDDKYGQDDRGTETRMDKSMETDKKHRRRKVI